MANEYQKFGTLEFRPSQRIDGHCDKFDMAGSDAHAFWSWREQGDDTGNVFEGLGFPVQDFTGAVVNFLKISVSGSRTDNDLCIEESLQPGHPIANTFVAFGKPTATIVITIDSLSAAALYLTTKHGTVAALHSGNLKAVCVHLRGRHPNSDFIVCVNGDGRDEHSRTLSEASEAARAIKAKVYASGSLTFFDQYLKDWGKSIEDVLCGVPAVSPWDHHRYDPALKMLGRPIAWPNRFNSAALLGNLMHWVKRYVCISDDLVLICRRAFKNTQVCA